MSNTERSQLLADLYKLRADLGVIFHQCTEARALAVALHVVAAQREVNECIEEIIPSGQIPIPLEFPRSKYHSPALS